MGVQKYLPNCWKMALKWQFTAPATGNVKMKRICFRSKRVCFSSANVGVVFSLFRNQKKVTVSALFCILMDNPWYTKGFSIRDIPHATLEEEEIFVSKKTWYRLLRKYCTAWEDRTYRPTGLRRAYRKTALTVDWLVGWLAAVLLLVEIMLWTLYCSLHYLGVVNANAFELATKCVRTRFILTLPLAGTVPLLSSSKNHSHCACHAHQRPTHSQCLESWTWQGFGFRPHSLSFGVAMAPNSNEKRSILPLFYKQS